LTTSFYFGICPSGDLPVDYITLVETGKNLIIPAFYDGLKTTCPETNLKWIGASSFSPKTPDPASKNK